MDEYDFYLGFLDNPEELIVETFDGYTPEEILAYQNEEITSLDSVYQDSFTLLENQSFTICYCRNDLLLCLLFQFPEDYPTKSFPIITAVVTSNNEEQVELSLKFQNICNDAVYNQKQNLGYHMVFNILADVQQQLVLLEKIPELAVSDFLIFETKPKAKKKAKIKKIIKPETEENEPQEESLDPTLKKLIVEDELKPFPKVETHVPSNKSNYWSKRWPSVEDRYKADNSDFTRNALFVQGYAHTEQQIKWIREVFEQNPSQRYRSARRCVTYGNPRRVVWRYYYKNVRPYLHGLQQRNVGAEVQRHIDTVMKETKTVRFLGPEHFHLVFTDRETVQNCMEADQEFYVMVCAFGKQALEWFFQAADLFYYKRACIMLLLAGIDLHSKYFKYRRSQVKKDRLAFYTEVKKQAKKRAKVSVRAIGQGLKNYPEVSEIHVMIVGSFLFPWMFETLV